MHTGMHKFGYNTEYYKSTHHLAAHVLAAHVLAANSPDKEKESSLQFGKFSPHQFHLCLK